MNIGEPNKRFINLPFMNRRESTPASNELRLPGIGFIPNRARNHLIAMLGEFVGTFLFLFFAFAGTQVANAGGAAASGSQADAKLAQAPNPSVLLYISLAFGFSLAVNVWVFFRISGGLFNPAVTLALALVGAINWTRTGLVFIAEMLAGMCASGVVAALFPGPLNVTTALNRTTSPARGVFIEMFLTAELIFAILMLAAEKHKGTFLAPVGIGLALFVAELAGVYYTGGSLNPARSFGPCVANATFPHEHWIYWVGPILGALVAVGFYRFVKMLEYETANPGADFTEKEAAQFKFDEDNARADDVVRPDEGAAEIEQRLGSGGGSLRGVNSMPADVGRDVSPTKQLRPSGDEGYRNGPITESGDLHPGFRPANAGA